MSDVKKPSGQEGIKETSLYLKGNIAEELASDDPYVSTGAGRMQQGQPNI